MTPISRSSLIVGAFCCLVLASLVLQAGAAPARAASGTYVKSMAATLVFQHGARADKPGNCSALVFAQWPDVKDTVSATVRYTWRGKESTKTFSPPWDDTYHWVIDYQAPYGSHWGQIGKSWGDGPTPNDCSESSAQQRVDFGSTALVDLTIKKQPPPVITMKKGPFWLSGRGTVSIGTVTCPTGGTCTSEGPEPLRVTYRNGSKRGSFTIYVKPPRTIAGGKTRRISLRPARGIPPGILGQSRTLKVKIEAANAETETSKTLAPTLNFGAKPSG